MVRNAYVDEPVREHIYENIGKQLDSNLKSIDIGTQVNETNDILLERKEMFEQNVGDDGNLDVLANNTVLKINEINENIDKFKEVFDKINFSSRGRITDEEIYRKALREYEEYLATVKEESEV